MHDPIEYDFNGKRFIIGAEGESAETSILRLKVYADNTLAFILALSSFSLVPYLVLLLPYIVAANDFLTSKRISKDQDKALRSTFEFPRRTFIRMVKKREGHVTSVPGFDLLFLTSDMIRNFASDEQVHAHILHEIGHIRQLDISASIWYIFSLMIWIVAFFLFFAGYFSGLFLEVENKLSLVDNLGLANAIFFWVMITISFILFIDLAIRTKLFYHDREYLADKKAINGNRDGLKQYLRFLIWHNDFETHEKRVFFKMRTKQVKTHPIPEHRLKNLETEKSLSYDEISNAIGERALAIGCAVVLLMIPDSDLFGLGELHNDIVSLSSIFIAIAVVRYWKDVKMNDVVSAVRVQDGRDGETIYFPEISLYIDTIKEAYRIGFYLPLLITLLWMGFNFLPKVASFFTQKIFNFF